MQTLEICIATSIRCVATSVPRLAGYEPPMFQKNKPLARLSLLRREDSNFRPSGYEPDELPLLYFAMWSAKVTGYGLLTKQNLKLTLCCCHACTFLSTGTAGLCAFLAMIHIMRTTFFGARATNVSAQLANGVGMFTLKDHELGGRSAHRSTFKIQLYAPCHHIHILLV